MTFKEFKTWLEREYEAVADIKSDCIKKGYHDSANFWIGYSKAMGEILSTLASVRQEKAQKTHNDFSWENVKLGDKVVNRADFVGKVVSLIYTENGFSSMRVFYEEDGGCYSTCYQDDDYKMFKQIGDWVNE